MTILVDLDETVWDLLDVWTKKLRDRFDVEVYPENVTEWDMSRIYPTLTAEQIYAPLTEEDTWKTVKPFDDAIIYLQILKEEGNAIFFLTTSRPKTLSMKIELLLKKYFPFISEDNVISASRKQMVWGDVLIDDNPRNLIGGMYRGILFTSPHNRDFPESLYGLKRANNWSEVYDLCHKISNERGGVI